MKTLKDIILERLKLTKDSKLIKEIPTHFIADNKLAFTKEDINIIQQYAQQLKVKPIVLTNSSISKYSSTNTLDSFLTNIFIYFNDDWDKKFQSNCIYFVYDIFNDNMWYCIITINGKQSYLYKGKFIYYSKNVEDICKELIKYLNENNEFYNAVKK